MLLTPPEDAESLRARLEVRDDGGPDGISCRDESIRMQDAEIARLRAEVERLTAVVKAANAQAEHFERQWYLRGDEVEALRADAQAVAALLPGPYYMDPPDGGSVTVIEQLRRMAADAARYRRIKRGASFREERDMGPGGCWSIFVAVPRRPAVNSLDTAIDAAMAQGKV